jgi:hypothetical protein
MVSVTDRRKGDRKDSRVACNPANISHACETVVGVDVEDIFDSEGCTEEISACGVDHALRFARGAGGLTGM